MDDHERDDIAQKLLTNIIEHLSPELANHTKVFFSTLISLITKPGISDSPGRRLDGKANISKDITHVTELLGYTLMVLLNRFNEDQTQTLHGLVQMNGCAIGPKGKDTLGRSTWRLYTPKGSIPIRERSKT